MSGELLTTTPRLCDWCAKQPAPGPTQAYCGRKCRQAAHRTRKRYGTVHGPGTAAGLRFLYADPPYVGKSKRYYADQPTYAGEVDHPSLIGVLERRRADGELAGWALSCSSDSLKGHVLPFVPAEHWIGAWGKLPNRVPAETYGRHIRWEALVVVGGRKRRPGVSDLLLATPARLGGETLPGRKPIAFCVWLFEALGMLRGDLLEDLYPGTGNVTRAWRAIGGPRGVVLGRETRQPGLSDAAVSPVDGRQGQRQLSLLVG